LAARIVVATRQYDLAVHFAVGLPLCLCHFHRSFASGLPRHGTARHARGRRSSDKVAAVTKTELERIKDVYLARLCEGVVDRYSPLARGELYMLQRREEETLRLLAKHGMTDLKGLKVLEIG